MCCEQVDTICNMWVLKVGCSKYWECSFRISFSFQVMSVIQLPSQSQMRNQNENHKTASPQLRFLQETLSNSFIFLISCIILDSILRLLLAGNDSKGKKKKISSVFKLLCSSFLLMCAVGKRCGVKGFHLKEPVTLTREKKLRFTNGLHRVPLLNQQLCSGNVYVHPQCLLLLIQCIWRPGVLAENKREVNALTLSLNGQIFANFLIFNLSS